MVNSIKIDHLPLKDLIFSSLIILVMAIIIANIFNPLWGAIYVFGNILTLTFLSWLYSETWGNPSR